MASLTSTWRTGATQQLRRGVAKSLAAQSTRQYASMPSKNKIVRELDRASRQGSNKMSKEQSMSNMQKMANAEYFRDGGGPLFPG